MKWKRSGMIAGVIAGTFLVMKYVIPVMLPFLLGLLLSIAVRPTAKKIESFFSERKIRLKQKTAGCMMILLLSGILVWILIEGMQFLSHQAGKAVEWYPVIKSEVVHIVGDCCERMEDAVGIPAGESREYIQRQFQSMSTVVLKGSQPVKTAIGSVKTCILFAGGAALSLLFAILIIQEGDIWKEKIGYLPVFEKVRRVLLELWCGVCGYIKAQIKIMGIIIVLCMIGLFLLGAKHFIVGGFCLGLLDALPVLGTGTFLLPGAFYFFIKGRMKTAVGCIILYGVTAGVRQFLEPRIVGEKVGVSPLLVLLSVYLGVFVYGGTGVILGPLSAFTIYGIIKEWRLLEWRPERENS